MANMSYCMFQNTLGDLEDCLDKIDYYMNGDTKLSEEESQAAKCLFNRVLDFCQDHDIIDDYDADEIDSMIDEMSEHDEDEDEDEESEEEEPEED